MRHRVREVLRDCQRLRERLDNPLEFAVLGDYGRHEAIADQLKLVHKLLTDHPEYLPLVETSRRLRRSPRDITVATLKESPTIREMRDALDKTIAGLSEALRAGIGAAS